MSEGVRRAVFLGAAAVLAALLGWGFGGVAGFGERVSPYGRTLASLAHGERRTANAVTAVMFDLRGLDSLGEEFILFAAVAGVALLLRPRAGEEEDRPEEELPDREVPESSDALTFAGFPLAAAAVLYGLTLVVRGHLTPGGGFQGGVMVGGGLFTIYLVSDFDVLRRRASEAPLQLVEGAGLLAYCVLGLVGMAGAGAFLVDFLPLGELGRLASGGTVPLLSGAVGTAVGAGVVLLLTDFLEQTLILREGRSWR